MDLTIQTIQNLIVMDLTDDTRYDNPTAQIDVGTLDVGAEIQNVKDPTSSDKRTKLVRSWLTRHELASLLERSRTKLPKFHVQRACTQQADCNGSI
ncbi:hypothetical protein TorRG33x02_075160 [Trema orientale]|uniref:Uncharacterized protein n=1 Tax=Trema orientale TaxID=63057 RepID=A0A2P5FGC8_TREOI|nr:hypothetical protein TorRG33x02_075160 [Trema orientale]